MEVLYDAMSNGARRLTMREFLHCYRPDEIDKSRGIYSFVPRSSLLKVIFETPDSNRDWKSRYFFLEGDECMCRPGTQSTCPSTWLEAYWVRPIRTHPSVWSLLHNRSIYNFFNNFIRLLSCSSTASSSWSQGVQFSWKKFCQDQARRKDLGQISHTRYHPLVLWWT